jgi:hypothetical protein
MKHICKYTFGELKEMKRLNNYLLFPQHIKEKAWANYKEEIELYPYSNIFTTKHQIVDIDNENYKPEWCDLYVLGKNYIIWNITMSTLRAYLYNKYIDNAYENVLKEDILNEDVIVEKRVEHIPNMYSKYNFLLDIDFLVGIGVEIVVDQPYLTYNIIESELSMFSDYIDNIGGNDRTNSEYIIIAEERINEFYNSFNVDYERNFFAISTRIDSDLMK